MSNSRGSFVGESSVRSAWHKARNRRVNWEDIKDEKTGKKIGQRKVVVMSEGPSLKVWATQKAVEGLKFDEGSSERNLAALCEAWLDRKTANVNADAKRERLARKGATIEAQKRAPRTGLKGHKKGSGGKKSDGGGAAKEKKPAK